MSNPEHRRPSAVDEFRQRCLDSLSQMPRMSRMSLRRWRATGGVILVVFAIGAFVVSGAGSTAPIANTDVELPRVSSTTLVRQVGSISGDIVVQVIGAVEKPGVHHLPSSARLYDAIEQAGGFTAEADVERINLAAKLVDGQSIYVARKGQVSVPEPSSMANESADRASDAPVDINTASEMQLQELPGVGPATAKAIADYRSKHGPFGSVDELGKVSGIGPSKLAQMRERARV